MKQKRRILYFMPDNPVSGKAGNLTRANQVLKYLSGLNDFYDIDFLSISGWRDWEQADKAKFVKKHPNINLFLIHRKGSSKNKIHSFFEYKIPTLFPKLFKRTTIDKTNIVLRRRVSNFLNTREYDIIIVSYASWANILSNYKGKGYLVLDTHDFITGQSRHKKNKIGKLFHSEINIMNRFDEIWTYSIEEEYIFGQFTDKKITLIPISFPIQEESKNESYIYDIIYVASDNSHNIIGINWFIKEALPYLKNHKIHIIGKICNIIPDHPNLIKYGLVDCLDSYYKNAKIAICPMLSGTGIKIKVLEALSYSLPVVTNRRGIDGLINKSLNGCLVVESGLEFANSIMKLLNDEPFYKEIKHYGRKYFLENHMINQEKKVLDRVFNNHLKSRC